jgi:hypothetical protein
MMKSRKFVTADDVIKTDFSSTLNIKHSVSRHPTRGVSGQLELGMLAKIRNDT